MAQWRNVLAASKRIYVMFTDNQHDAIDDAFNARYFKFMY